MSTLSQFFGMRPTTQIVNAKSSGATQSAFDVNASDSNGGREVLSGALTASTLKTLLTVTGSGRAPYLAAYAKNSTARDVRLLVQVDGVVVFDNTVSASTINRGLFAAGCAGWNGALFLNQGEPIRFNASLVVQVSSSLTETDNVAIGYSVV